MSKACRQTANTAAHTCQKIIGMNINYDVLFKKNTDKADLNFVSNFFMSLGDEALVIEPLEIWEFILASARKLLDQYS